MRADSRTYLPNYLFAVSLIVDLPINPLLLSYPPSQGRRPVEGDEGHEVCQTGDLTEGGEGHEEVNSQICEGSGGIRGDFKC